jgi:hypothetical protein
MGVEIPEYLTPGRAPEEQLPYHVLLCPPEVCVHRGVQKHTGQELLYFYIVDIST